MKVIIRMICDVKKRLRQAEFVTKLSYPRDIDSVHNHGSFDDLIILS